MPETAVHKHYTGVCYDMCHCKFQIYISNKQAQGCAEKNIWT